MYEIEPLPPGVRLLTDPEFERLLTRVPDIPRTPEHCITCHGTGTFQWWMPSPPSHPGRRDGYSPWKCDCQAQWVLHCYLHHAGIPVGYQRLGWDDVTAVGPDIRAQVEEYREHADRYVQAGFGLILHGTQGTGKTLLAVLLLKGLLGKGYSGYFTSFADLIGVFTQTWRSDDERAWFEQRIRNVTFLVVDDPGKEHGGARGSDLARAAFDGVLRHRVASSLPTIVTTNNSMAETKQSYGDGIYDLLFERAVTLRFTAASFRIQNQERVLQEINLGLTRPVVLG